MKRSWAFVLALLAGGWSARAATVTLTIDYFYTCTEPQWSLYATVSPDSGGLFSYNIDLNGTWTTISHRANGVRVTDADGTGESTRLGFTHPRSENSVDGTFSGAQETFEGDSFIPVYGIGQQDDDLDNYIPPEFERASRTFGAGRAPYSSRFLLAQGRFNAFPTFNQSATSVKVFNNRTDVGISDAQILYRNRVLDGICNVNTSLTNSSFNPNQAVDGSIRVTGGNNAYVSEVDQLVADAVLGAAPIETIGPEAGSIYVMAKLLGTTPHIAYLLDKSSNDVSDSDPESVRLHAAYDGQFGAGGFNALFRFPNIAGARVFSWDFIGTEVTVGQLAAVPEPGVGFIAGAAAVLVCRRKRMNSGVQR